MTAKVTTLKRKFKDEWILLKPTKNNQQGWVEEGQLLAHSKSRSYLYKRAENLKPKHFTILFTGARKILPRI